MRQPSTTSKIAQNSSSTTIKKPRMGVAVIALVINALVPGLGTIIGGRVKTGLIQFLLLFLLGLSIGVLGAKITPASLLLGTGMALVGGIMLLTGWIWAILSSAMLIKKAAR